MGEDHFEQSRWVLFAYGVQFELGNGLTFCTDVLGMTPSELMEVSGHSKIESYVSRRNLARFIVEKLGITRKNAFDYEIKKTLFHLRR